MYDLSGRHWINGRWNVSDGEPFNALNPAIGETLNPPFAEATVDEVDAAVSGARQAFLAVRDRDPRWPAELLDAIALQVEELGDQLLERAEAETALLRPRLIG